MTSQEQKKAIRKRISTIKAQYSNTQLQAMSDKACRMLLQRLNDFLPVSRIGIYLGMPNELRTYDLIRELYQEGKHHILLPRVMSKESMLFIPYKGDDKLERSKFGILEPKYEENEEIPEVLIMPGVAFDKVGSRVGYGGGYYDRYIEKHQADIKCRIAVAYHFQLLTEPLPKSEHDYPVEELITEQVHLIFK